jgi:hypothetical protein
VFSFLTDLRQLYFAVNKNMGIAGFFSSEYKKKLLWGSKKAAVEQVDLLVFEFMHRDFPNSLLQHRAWVIGRLILVGSKDIGTVFTGVFYVYMMVCLEYWVVII